MPDDQFLWRPQDDEFAAAEDIAFLDELSGDHIALSRSARHEIGDDTGALASAIAQMPRRYGGDTGEVRWNGRDYTFELIRTELTWTERPLAPYDPYNFTREVSVCTLAEAAMLKRSVARK